MRTQPNLALNKDNNPATYGSLFDGFDNLALFGFVIGLSPVSLVVRDFMNLTPLEKEVLDWFALHNIDESLQQQCAQAFVTSREYTGVGMYINLSCPSELNKVEFNCAPNAPFISSPLLKHGAGVDLWFESGRIHYIEIVAFGDILFPESQFSYSLVDSL